MDETLPQEHMADKPVTYQDIERGSQRGKPLLVDTLGKIINILNVIVIISIILIIFL